MSKSATKGPTARNVTKRAPKSSKTAAATKSPASKATPRAASRTTKQQTVIALLQRSGGATIAALCDATGWQKHSIRGFLAGQLKKLGFRVRSEKNDGVRSYSIAA